MLGRDRRLRWHGRGGPVRNGRRMALRGGSGACHPDAGAAFAQLDFAEAGFLEEGGEAADQVGVELDRRHQPPGSARRWAIASSAST